MDPNDTHGNLNARLQSAQEGVIEHQNLGVINASGADAEQFLQAQLTCDLRTLDEHHWLPGGHCDAKGKLWSVFRIFRHDQGFMLLMNSELLPKSLAELKKFSVFNKVEFTDESEQWRSYLFLGDKAARDHGFSATPQDARAMHSDSSGCLLHLDKGIVLALLPTNGTPINTTLPSEQAAIIDMQLGWPLVASSQQQEHIPQTLNLDQLGAVSFKKGCYIGQETIARMHYKGQTKRRMQLLVGKCTEIPTENDVVERQVGDNWRRAGAVLSSVRYDSDVVAVQAILPVDLDESSPLRIKGQDDSQFTPLSAIRDNGIKE